MKIVWVLILDYALCGSFQHKNAPSDYLGTAKLITSGHLNLHRKVINSITLLQFSDLAISNLWMDYSVPLVSNFCNCFESLKTLLGMMQLKPSFLGSNTIL